VTGHGGDILSASQRSGLRPDDIVDFSSNINPLGPPEAVRRLFRSSAGEADPACGEPAALVSRYPDSECRCLRAHLAGVHRLEPEQILVGNGSTELIYLLMRALAPARVAAFPPCYADYWRASEQAGAEVSGYVGRPESGFRPADEALRTAAEAAEVVWVGHPNNPCGWILEREQILRLARANPETVFVVDEAFVEFLSDYEERTCLSAAMPRNVVVLRSLTKFFAIPGLRLGFVVAHPDLLHLMGRFKEPWTVNALAQEAGLLLYDEVDYIRRTRANTACERRFLYQELSALEGIEPFPSVACYLLARGLLIREGANFRGLDASYVRFAVKNRDDNVKLLSALRAALAEPVAVP